MPDDLLFGSEPQAASAADAAPHRAVALTPTALAIAMLSRREHSRVEIVRKLLAKGVAAEVATAVAEDLAGREYQSDSRFADMLARTRIADGCGPLRIAADLRAAGVDTGIVTTAQTSALEYHGIAWIDVARETLRRRGLAQRHDLATQRRAFAMLQRRGFDGDTIRAALRRDRSEDTNG
ncbi:MAG: regulatory protein RecX [Lysobacterales bacterium]